MKFTCIEEIMWDIHEFGMNSVGIAIEGRADTIAEYIAINDGNVTVLFQTLDGTSRLEIDFKVNPPSTKFYPRTVVDKFNVISLPLYARSLHAKRTV